MTDNDYCCRLSRKFSILFILAWLLGVVPVLGDVDAESAARGDVAPVLVQADGVGSVSDENELEEKKDMTSAESESSTSGAGQGGEDIWNQEFYGYPLWMVAAVAGGVVFLLIVLMAASGKKDKDEGRGEEDGDESVDTSPVYHDDSPMVMAMDEAGADAESNTDIEDPEVEVVLLPSSEANEPVEETAGPVKWKGAFELGDGIHGTVTCQTMPESDEEIVASLLFGEGGSSGVYPVSKTATRIGRGVDNDLSLNNDSVSRHHAEILCKGDGAFVITDLDSGNGVFVNDEETAQTTLESGDKVEIGEVTFTFMPSV